PDGLAGWWPGDNNYSDIVNGNTGTPNGGVAFTTGTVNQTMGFNGSTAYVNVPDSAALHLHDAVTLAAWIKPTPADFDGQTHGIISKPTAGTGWALRMEGNGLNFGFNNGIVNCSVGNSSQAPLTVGEWSFVAATFQRDAGTDVDTV